MVSIILWRWLRATCTIYGMYRILKISSQVALVAEKFWLGVRILVAKQWAMKVLRMYSILQLSAICWERILLASMLLELNQYALMLKGM